MIRLVIIGTGNVARRLFDLWNQTDSISVIQVVGRDLERLSYFKDHVAVALMTDTMAEADIYLLAVSDDAIREVSPVIKGDGKFVVHTSGSVPIQALPRNHRRGVFYPLQTFSGNRPLQLKGVPVCIEAGEKADLELLRKLGSSLSAEIVEVSSEKRKYLHLAAVFANNFTNHLYYISQQLAASENLPANLLLPLILETSDKLKDMDAYNAQTGPARRLDDHTLEQQLQLLKNKQQREIYMLLSNSIRKTYV